MTRRSPIGHDGDHVSPAARVLLALVLALVVGLVGRVSGWPGMVGVADAVAPIGTVWVNAIRMTVIPLVVSLLVSGVAASAGIRELRAIGRRLLAACSGLMVLSAAVGLLVVPPLFAWLDLDPSTIAAIRGAAEVPSATTAAGGLTEFFTSAVPANPVRAAADGAMMPIVVFALAFALALLNVPLERRRVVHLFFAGISDAMLAIIRVVIAVAPIGVFALVLPVVVRTGLAAAGALGYYVAITAVALSVLVVLMYPAVAVFGGVSLARFARALLPAQAVAMGTSSSLASLPAMIDGADRRLGLPSTITGVVLPLAVSSFKVTGPTIWLVAVVFLGQLYGVPLSTGQLVTVALMGFLGGMTAPGVPHGWLLGLAPLAASMHIPAEGIGLLIAVDAIPDVFATIGNVTGDMAAAAIVSRGQPPGTPPPVETGR